MNSSAAASTPPDQLRALFGDALRHFRRQRKLSQTKLAKLSGVSRSQVGAYERGERWAMARSLSRLLDTLEVTALEFFGDVQTRARITSIALVNEPTEGETVGQGTRYADGMVQIRIKEIDLMIPANRFSIDPSSRRPSRGGSER